MGHGGHLAFFSCLQSNKSRQAGQWQRASIGASIMGYRNITGINKRYVPVNLDFPRKLATYKLALFPPKLTAPMSENIKRLPWHHSSLLWIHMAAGTARCSLPRRAEAPHFCTDAAPSPSPLPQVAVAGS